MTTAEKPGRQVGGWHLLEVMGTGAFGVTWRAEDPSGARAAVKLLNRPPGDEFEVLSRVAHPAIIGVLGAGGGEQPYLAMELAPGRTLSELGDVTEDDALHIVAALLDALAALHRSGLTHGDIKPDNLMVHRESGRPTVKLVDFGVSGGGRGGTLAWASPERLRGELASSASDVYAAGLVLWVLLHGELPFAELPLEKMLLRRRDTEVTPQAGAPWVRELLLGMLALDAGRRPDAADAADALQAHGIALPTIDAAWLRHRGRTVRVPGPGDEIVERWLVTGGISVVVGAPGAGKSHVVKRAAVELTQRGAMWVEIRSFGPSWSGITAALADPRLPGRPVASQHAHDPVDRAYQAARQLLRRAGGPLFVLIDDWASLDEGTRLAIEVLVGESEPVHVLVTSEAPVCFETRTIVRTEELEPWGDRALGRLVAELLGSGGGPIPALDAFVVGVARGRPGLAIDAVIQAMEVGALRREERGWTCEPGPLGALSLPERRGRPLTGDLTALECRIGAVIAAHAYPIPRDHLESLVDEPPKDVATAVHQLVVHGLVRAEGGLVQSASVAAAEVLLAAVTDLASIHRDIARALVVQGPSSRLGWHLVHAEEPAGVHALGAACVARAREEEAGQAAELAEALWTVAQSWELAEQCVLAMVGARRSLDAASFAAQLEPGAAGLPPPVPQGVLVAWARALVAADRSADALTVIRKAQATARQAGPRRARRDVELQEVHALALSRLGRLEIAAKVALAATAQVPAVDATPESEDAWLRARTVAAECLQRMGDLGLAIDQLAEVPEGLGAGRATRGSLDARLGRLYWNAKRYRESAQVFAEAARMSGGLSALDRARLSNNSALASFKVGDPAAAVAQWERARVIFDRLRAEEPRISVQLNLCVGYLELGRWERARRAGTWALERAKQVGHVRFEAMAAGNLGDVYRQLEQRDLAAAMYTDALTLAEEHGFPEEIAENLRRLGQLALEAEDGDALARCELAERRASEHGIHAEAGLAASLSAVARAGGGDADGASEALARARGHLAEHGEARELAEWRLCSARVHLFLGRSERAMTELAKVVLFAEEVGSVQLRARADRVAQQLDAARLDPGPLRESLLLDMAVAVAQEQDLESLLQSVADAARELTRADRAFVVKREGRRVIASSASAHGGLSQPSWSVAERCMDERREIIVADLGDRPDLRASISVLDLDLRSVMCVPLVRAADVLGALYVDSNRAGEQELVALGRYLRALAGYAAIAMANEARLAEHDRQIEEASALAHDMRNLALVLIGLAEHVTEIDGDPETVESMVDVKQVGDQLVQMTERFLAPSAAPPRVVSLSELVGQLASIVRHEADRRRIELVVDAPPGHLVLVDPESMRRALFNIVHNAFKYCGDDGRVALSVSGTNDAVYFTVHDSGPGIPEDIAPYIFDYRRQGHQSRQGFGIGLSVASRAVEAAGGTIRAGNHPNGGGLITIVLPRRHDV